MITESLPARAVLRGVPRVHFYEGGKRCPEDVPFPSVMRAVFEYLGENLGCKTCRPLEKSWGLGCAYSYFSAVCGAAFGLAWVPGWQEESYGQMNFLDADPAEPYRRAFAATGYGCAYLPAGTSEAALRAQVRESIAGQQRPLIAFGVAGPPEASIITGYDEEGAVLIGWSFFQNMPEFSAGLEREPAAVEASGAAEAAAGRIPEDSGEYFRQRGWYDGSQALLVIGEKGTAPPQNEVFLRALRQGAAIMRAPSMGSAHTGLAAYTAWAADLERDEFFPAGEEGLLRQRHALHDHMVGMVAELRWYAAQWILNTFERVHWNQFEALLHAAACFAGEHELMWQAWDLAGGNGSPDGWRKLADPATRREMAKVILAAREKDAQALCQIETALRK